jgi:Asp-tRNA(Asn)/Glu-tRNA(Gln) amidotransferase A subunit family amidase
MKERKVALAVGSFIEEVTDPEVLQAVRKAAEVLKEQGALITEVNAGFSEGSRACQLPDDPGRRRRIPP